MFVKAEVKANVAAGGSVMDEDLAGKWICPMHPSVIKSKTGECDICGMDLVTTESRGYISDLKAAKGKPLVIPATAPLITGTRAVVYVEIPDAEVPTYEGREVVLGPRAGEYYIVRHGLKAGERVVTRGNFKIDSAIQIQAKPSMMTPEGGATPGEHMHGPSEKEEEKPKAAIPSHFLEQIRVVFDAAEAAEQAVDAGELETAKSAFTTLYNIINDVDSNTLDEHPKMVWKEYAMRLLNDAFEGREAETMEEASKVARSLADNIASLRERFDLGRKHSPDHNNHAQSSDMKQQDHANE
jgi:Cu(I)/Ag(I) efflux system membrane fusion protein